MENADERLPKGDRTDMPDCLIACRSMTYAQRIERALGRAGLRSNIIKVKSGFRDEGCVYAVKTPEKTIAQAVATMETNHLAHQGLYMETPDGEYIAYGELVT